MVPTTRIVMLFLVIFLVLLPEFHARPQQPTSTANVKNYQVPQYLLQLYAKLMKKSDSEKLPFQLPFHATTVRGIYFTSVKRITSHSIMVSINMRNLDDGLSVDHQFTFEFTSTYIPYKRKQDFRRKIIDNGGTISYILNKQTKFLVSGNNDVAETYKGRTALKLGIPVVSLEFVDDCAEKQKLLDCEQYLVAGKSSAKQFSCGIIKASVGKSKEINQRSKVNFICESEKSSVNLKSTRVYLYKTEQNTDEPFFPTNYEIIKHAWFKKVAKNGIYHFWSVELHVSILDNDKSVNDDDQPGQTYRIFTHFGIMDKEGIKDSKKECRFALEPNDARQLYALLCWQQSSFHREFSVFPPGVGSDKMLLTNFESESFEKENAISTAVTYLVHSFWSEAVGELTSLLAVPADKINIEDIDKAEAVLLSLLEMMNDGQSSNEECKKQSDDFHSLIPHNPTKRKNIDTKRVLVEKQDLCQLIKDMVKVSEATNFSHRSSDVAKYKALRCRLEVLSKSTDQYQNIVNNIQSTQYSGTSIKVENIFSCNRPIESNNFSNLGNKRQLFHSSRAQNFLGILSRGLLPPKLVVEEYGGERTDIGHLGTGIYFASSAGASVKYSAPGQVRGSRFMLICDVALGNVKDYTKFSTELNSPPEGYHSCHGVRRRGGEIMSDFEDDEYVVYAVNQQMIRYLVEFSLPGDSVRSLTDGLLNLTINEERILSEPTNAPSLDKKDDFITEEDDAPDVDITDVENMEDSLSKVKAGLKYEGETLVPLQSVHIRAKLLDLCSKVVVMQVYKNPCAEPIEAKYVFPLDDMAAVCGFEAFINGKHIIGEVKEKEEAHKEYKKAISEGHGAYLMDEETPDIFTVSVGNIPSGATVLIKISYVAELAVEGDNITFDLPGSLAPWKRSEARDVTQEVLETVEVDDDLAFELSVQIAVEMPFDIRNVECPTHKIRIKKTATKAVVLMTEGQSLENGFQLLIGLAEIHVPRMWVERHPKKPDSQACMLSFYPEFEAHSMSNVELLFLLDLSCSMQGTALDNAKKVLLLALHNLPENSIFNIIGFGGHWVELFPTSVLKTDKNLKEATDFVKRCRGNMGCSELWKILKGLSLLPVRADVDIRNICIISDGHVSEEETTLNLISTNRQHSRIFTFGVGFSTNRYFMRIMAQVGAGASEYFEPKLKSKWKLKVQSQLMKSQQPVLTSVSVAWQQFDNDAPKPIQAPNQILSLFSGSRLVVYGFIPFCTLATLKAEIKGKEISTMVSSSELSITTGETLHQLTARAIINDWEQGSLANDQLQHQVVKRKQKNYIIEISKEYSVTSKFTSFVAIEHRNESEKFNVDRMPNIQEILSDEDVDILSYIGWEGANEVISKILDQFSKNPIHKTGESGLLESEDDGSSTSEEFFEASDSTESANLHDELLSTFPRVCKNPEGVCVDSEELYPASEMWNVDCEDLYEASAELHDVCGVSQESYESSEEDFVSYRMKVTHKMGSASEPGEGYIKQSLTTEEYTESAKKVMFETASTVLEERDTLSFPVKLDHRASIPVERDASSARLQQRGKSYSSLSFGVESDKPKLCDEQVMSVRNCLSTKPQSIDDTKATREHSFGDYDHVSSRYSNMYDSRRPLNLVRPSSLLGARTSGTEPSSLSSGKEKLFFNAPNLHLFVNALPADASEVTERLSSFGSTVSSPPPSQLTQTLDASSPRPSDKTLLSSFGSTVPPSKPLQRPPSIPLAFGEPPHIPSKQLASFSFGTTGPQPRSLSSKEPASFSLGTSVSPPRPLRKTAFFSTGSPVAPPPPPLIRTASPPSLSKEPAALSCPLPGLPPAPLKEPVSVLFESAVPAPHPSKEPMSLPLKSDIPPLLPLEEPTMLLRKTAVSLPPLPQGFGSLLGGPTTSPPLHVKSGLCRQTQSYIPVLPFEEPSPIPAGPAKSVLLTPAQSRRRRYTRKAAGRDMTTLSAIDEPTLQSNNTDTSVPYQPTSPHFLIPTVRDLRGRKKRVEFLSQESGGLDRSMSRLYEATKKEPLNEEVIMKLFHLQSNEGSWNIPDSNLDKYLGINTKEVVNLLKDSGAMSLGPPVFNMVSKVLATLIVLAFLRNHFQHFFPLYLLPPFKPHKKLEETGTRWQHQTQKALTWLVTADKLVPSLCTRLQLGTSWEVVVPRLLKLPSKSDP